VAQKKARRTPQRRAPWCGAGHGPEPAGVWGKKPSNARHPPRYSTGQVGNRFRTRGAGESGKPSTARTAQGGKAMTRPGPRILDRHGREGPKVDTAEGLAKSPWCAAPCEPCCRGPRRRAGPLRVTLRCVEEPGPRLRHERDGAVASHVSDRHAMKKDPACWAPGQSRRKHQPDEAPGCGENHAKRRARYIKDAQR
jgi:hypothetical protein